MIEDLQKIFNLAIRAYLPPLDEANQLPVIGIAFANIDCPKQIEKILKPISGKFKIYISLSGILLNLKVVKATDGEQLFDTSLNYENREYEVFKNQIGNKSQGAFVVGAIHNGQFMIVSENSSSFRPYQVESFELF